MEVFIVDQIKTLAESCILGLIFGAGYDIIKIIRLLCGIVSCSGCESAKHGRIPFVIFLVTDLAYMILITFTYSVFLYHNNNGVFRFYLFTACLCGFILYYRTIGRLVMYMADTIINILKFVVCHILIRPIAAVCRMIVKLMRIIVAMTVGKMGVKIYVGYRKYYMRRIRKKISGMIKI